MPIIHDNSNFTSVTHGQIEVEDFTFPIPDTTSEWTDTGIDLPQYSVIDYIMLKITTNGAVDSGKYYIVNWGLGSTTYTMFGSDAVAPGAGGGYWGLDLTNPYGASYHCMNAAFGGAGQSYYLINVGSAMSIHVKTATTATSDPGTAAIADILIGYKTFGTS